MKLLIFLTILLPCVKSICSSNCASCNYLHCIACSPGYQLDINGNCIPEQLVPHCSVYFTNTTCSACQPTYLVNRVQTCSKDYSGCISYDDFSGLCTACSFGKSLKNGACTGVLNCGTYNNSRCQKCLLGFVLKGNVCYWIGGGCQTLDPVSGSCTICLAGYELIGFSCIPEAELQLNCYLFTNKSECKVCKSGYITNTFGECVIPPTLICLQYDVKSKCINCSDERLVIRNGTCVDPFCVNGSVGDCKKCLPAYIVKNQTKSGLCDFYDPQCVTYNKGATQCQTCSKGYFVNSNGSCSPMPPNCIAADVINLTCLTCDPSYILFKDSCSKPGFINNCAVLGPTKTGCLVCQQGYFLSSNSTCKKVSILCNGYDPSTGACLGCKGGYLNFGGLCVDLNCQTQNADVCTQCKNNFAKQSNGLCYFSDPNCEQANIISCITCKTGYYNKLGLCAKLPSNCLVVSNDGICTTCVQGYQFYNGNCIVPISYCKVYQNSSNSSVCEMCELGFNLLNNKCELISSNDPNCLSIKNGVCVLCSNRFYFAGSKCQPVNPNCKSYSMNNGSCTDCYPGYLLTEGSCLPAPPKDPFCKNVTLSGCSECYQSYYLQNNVCLPVNTLCKTVDNKGQCLSCYSGYALRQGSCSASFTDPNCVKYAQNGTCLICSDKYYQRNGICNRVSPLCRTYNTTNGSCLSCYPGYYLAGGACWAGNDPNADPNCNLRSLNGSCLQCTGGYFVASNGYCRAVNPLCKTFNNTSGDCLSCYSGYIIQNKTCALGNGNADPNCLTFADKGGCLQCYSGFYISASICKQVNQLCKTTNYSDGSCLSCYPGYSLLQGNCVIPNNYNFQAQNPYCSVFNNSQCVKCQTGYYLTNTSCTMIDPQCQNFDKEQGKCITCYKGYQLNEGICMISAQAVIPFCQILTADGKYCKQCMDMYYTMTPSTCYPVSILCGTYDPNTGTCRSCRNGYFFRNGQCIYPAMGLDQNCLDYDASAYCSTCNFGYYLLNYVCTKVNPNCVEFDYTSNICNKCGNGLSATGTNCV